MSTFESAGVFNEYQLRNILTKSKSQKGILNSSNGAVVSQSSRPHIQKSYSEQESPPTTISDGSQSVSFQISPSQVDNINQIRRLVREQSSVNSVNADDDKIEVPIRKFTPLPDIPRLDDAFYRTESILIKESIEGISGATNAIFIENLKSDLVLDNKELTSNANSGEENSLILFSNTNKSQPFNNYIRKETRYHFGSNSSISNKINFGHRLPALEKNFNSTINNTMDLDEDLPMNPISTPEYINHRMIYTSPGDRVISPIKRPQAPSPAASAYRRKSYKSFNNSQSDVDNDLIIT